MGKGEIQSELGDGQYSVKLIYDGRTDNAAKIAAINAQVAAWQLKYDAMPESTPEEILAKSIVGLQIKSLEKSAEYYRTKFPGDPTVEAWCADKTEGLTGEVATIEIPGELTDDVNISPGYDGSAAWDKIEDGQLYPAVGMGPWSWFLDTCMLPGWQKFNPTYRYGTIVADSIDFDNDTCTVCLDPSYSSQQNLDVNQDQGFSECAADPHSGFTDFCSRNPTHPTCTNTEAPAELYVSDTDYATIQAAQEKVNSEHEYETDKSGFGISDYWDIMGPGDRGDCEDFSLSKMQELIDRGFNVKNLQIAIGYTETGQGHAVLLIQTANKGTLVLDNRYENVKRIENVPYQFLKYQRAGLSWAGYATLLENVSIEYMNCNAAAFADGDDVLVEFSGQDWDQPKVIGFKDNPAGCEVDIYQFFGHNSGSKWQSMAVNLETKVATHLQDWVSYVFNQDVCSAAVGKTIYMPGGWTSWMADPYTPAYKIFKLLRSFNTSTLSWADKTDMPVSARSGMAGAAVGGKAYFFNGLKYFDDNYATYPDCGASLSNLHNDAIEYDPALDAWETKTNVPHKWWRSGARTIDNKINLFAGNDGPVPISGQCHPVPTVMHYQYDPVADAWTTKTQLSAARTGCASGVVDGKNYLFGGWAPTGGSTPSVTANGLIYDSASNSWIANGTFPLAFAPPVSRASGSDSENIFMAQTGPALFKYFPETDTYEVFVYLYDQTYDTEWQFYAASEIL